MTTPDYFGELTAWRKFNVRDRGRVLVSANHPIPWTTADPGEAVCIADAPFLGTISDGETTVTEHGECPALKCSCGFYAYKEQTDALQHGQGVVLAQVKVWGRIAEHTRGYRAARMRISELYLPDAATGDVDALALRYGVAVFVGGDLWTSVKPNELSQLNQLQSHWNALTAQYLTPAIAGLQQSQNRQLSQLQAALHQQALQAVMLTPKAPYLAPPPYTAPPPSLFTVPPQFSLASLYTMPSLILSDGWEDATAEWRDAPKQAKAPRQYFDFD